MPTSVPLTSAANPAPARVPRWFWLALLLLHAAYFGFQMRHRTHLFPDSGRYLTEAINIRQAGEFYALPLDEPRQAQEYTIRPPGYPLLLLAWGATSGSVVGVLLAQNLLSLLNLGLIARLVARQRLRSGQWLALLALIATYPAQFIYANVLMSEIALQTCVVMLLLSAVTFLQSRQPRHLAWAALSVVAALLIKPVFYPFSAVFSVLMVAYAIWQRRPIAALLGAVPLTVVLLYQGWNYQRTGYYHFSSISEINLLRYNVRGALRATEGAEAAEQFVAAVVRTGEAQPSFAAQQHYITAQSTAVLRRYPLAYAWLHTQGMVNFFLDPGRFDVVHFLGLSEASSMGLLGRFSAHGYAGILTYLATLPLGLLAGLLLIAASNVVRLLLFLLFLLEPSAPWPLRAVAVLLVLYVAFLTGPLGAARFGVPVFPLLLLALPSAHQRWQRLLERKKRTVVVAGV